MKRGKYAARSFAKVVPTAGMNDTEKLRVYDRLREAHMAVRAIYDNELLDSANDEQGQVVDAVNTVLYLAEGVFAKMSD